VQYHPLFPPLTRSSRPIHILTAGCHLDAARTTEEHERFALLDLSDLPDLPGLPGLPDRI
jgi:hypothetical protein